MTTIAELNRKRLPYGVWTCADGRQVLFDRKYIPMWERTTGQPAKRANTDERVPWVKQDYLFDDSNPPFRPTWLPRRNAWHQREITEATKRRCESVLAEWHDTRL